MPEHMRTNDHAQLRRDAVTIFHRALAAVDPYVAVKTHVERDGHILRVGGEPYDLRAIERILVVGAGKASSRMALAIEELLGDCLTDGLVVVKYGHVDPLRIVRLKEAGHPVPDQAGMEGASEILELVTSARRDDLVICLISGGGSSLMPLPSPGLDLDAKRATTEALLACGATIHEMNAVRKHMSAVKGGGLARAAAPARVISLILSDVIGDDLDVIASGPTVPDRTTFATALDVLARHGGLDRVPERVRMHLEAGNRGEVPETPKPGDPIFDNVHNVIIASNAMAVDVAAREAAALGYDTLVLSSFVQGEAREVGRVFAAVAREMCTAGRPVASPGCIVAGGETTVTIRGDGLGGRSQELALSAAIDLDGLEGVVLLAAGTDGTDGPTDAAGAVVDGRTISRARAMGLSARDHLANNDSHRFFRPLGDLVVTGPTRTNVMDLVLVLTSRDAGSAP